MKHAVFIAMSLTLVVVSNCFGQADATAATEKPAPERLLFPTQHIEPAALTEKLLAVFNDGSVTMSAFPGAKAVLISAPPKTMKEIVALLDRLDRQPQAIALEFWVLDLQPEN